MLVAEVQINGWVGLGLSEGLSALHGQCMRGLWTGWHGGAEGSLRIAVSGGSALHLWIYEKWLCAKKYMGRVR